MTPDERLIIAWPRTHDSDHARAFAASIERGEHRREMGVGEDNEAVVERIARTLAANLSKQEGAAPDDWVPAENWDYAWDYIDQGYVDFRELARAVVIELPRMTLGRQG